MHRLVFVFTFSSVGFVVCRWRFSCLSLSKSTLSLMLLESLLSCDFAARIYEQSSTLYCRARSHSSPTLCSHLPSMAIVFGIYITNLPRLDDQCPPHDGSSTLLACHRRPQAGGGVCPKLDHRLPRLHSWGSLFGNSHKSGGPGTDWL